MTDRTIVTLVPRDTTPARPVGRAAASVDEGLAPVVPLRPATLHDGVVHRLIQPLHVPAGTVLREVRFTDNVVVDTESYDPGPLARALMAAEADGR
jgi:hypothetical protein